LPEFNAAYAGAGIPVPSIMTFPPLFYTVGHAGSLSDLCHKCVTDM